MEAGYSDATETVFLESCTAGLGAGGRAVCRCAYDEVVRTVPFASYERIDLELRDDPGTIPTDLQLIVADCTAQVVSPPTPSTTQG